MKGHGLGAGLPAHPLLHRGLVPGAAVETIADPFIVGHRGRLFVLAEVLGRRASGPFKKIGVFAVDDDLGGATWLGDACPDDDGLCSFPYVVRDGDRYLMVPEVFVPFQGGAAAWLQVMQIWETAATDFPFGWMKIHEGLLGGSPAPSDKVLFRRGGRYWLVASDNAHRRLMAYHSSDLRTWRPHPRNPWVDRDRGPAAGPATPGSVPGPLAGARWPWRLGGGPLLLAGELALPLQHAHGATSYGGAVTLLRVHAFDAERFDTSFDDRPLLAQDADRPWMAHGAHHLSLTRHAGRVVVATDGFDGSSWSSAVFERPHGLPIEPMPEEPSAASSAGPPGPGPERRDDDQD